MAEWSGGGGHDDSGGGLNKGRSGRRKHWKLPDMIQGVRHRFRDRLTGGRSKSPDSTLEREEEAIFRGSQTSVYRMAATGETYTSFASTTSLPRAASLLSTDYGFNDWGGLEDLTPAAGYQPSSGPHHQLAAAASKPSSDPIGASLGVQSKRQAEPRPVAGYNTAEGGVSSFLGSDPFPGYPHRPPVAARRPANPAGASAQGPALLSGTYAATSPRPATAGSSRDLTGLARNNSFGPSGGLQQPQHIRAFPASGHNGPPPPLGRAMSINLVNHAGLGNPPVGAQNSNGHIRTGSIPRGKSVRFGENRISVFLQDSTQALEECVRLALSYAEESKGRSGSDYCSDSEAVILSRQLTHHQDQQPAASLLPRSRQFWSDSEDRGDGGSGDEVRGQPRSAFVSQPAGSSSFGNPLPGDTGASLGGAHHRGCENGYVRDGPSTPTDYRPRMLFGQAVNSLDRVERLSADKHRRHRQQRTTHINEIFSFIDKVLSGCENGCSDEACPMARRSQHGDAGGRGGGFGDSDGGRGFSGGGGEAGRGQASSGLPERLQPHLEVKKSGGSAARTVYMIHEWICYAMDWVELLH
jgi:hypothetical protein